VEFLSQKVYFAGEWNKPGPHVLSEPLTLIEAVAVGGNLSRFAKGDIVLIRKAAANGGSRYRATLKDILAGTDGIDKTQLRRGDVLFAE
jgi:protein involved in polysaccharide export with SLBB domain